MPAKLGWGLGIIGFLCFVAVAAPWLSPYDPTAQHLRDRLQPPLTQPATVQSLHSKAVIEKRDHPSPRYLLGTDMLGRDMLSRVLVGARASLGVAGVAVLLAGSVGTVLGLWSGAFGGWQGRWTTGRQVHQKFYDGLQAVVNLWQATPYMLVMLALVGVWGKSMSTLIGLLALSIWVPFYRVAHVASQAQWAQPYVLAARALGATDRRILWRHVLPGVLPGVLSVATSLLANVIIFETALSFLGLGMPDDVISWGTLAAAGRGYEPLAWWLPMVPGVAIFIAVWGFNILGEGLEEWLEPTQYR